MWERPRSRRPAAPVDWGMPRRRWLLVSLVAASGLLLGTLFLPQRSDPSAVHLAALYDPYAVEPLRPYGTLRQAVRSGDALALQRIAAESDGYLAYLASLELARWRTIDAGTRLDYMRRALALRIDDPLARDETRSLNLEAGRIAEDAGDPGAAAAYYRDALPLPDAVSGLERLEPDRRRVAQDLLDARVYGRALAVLGDLPDPSLRAQAELDLGHYDLALPAYRQWVAQAPDDASALGGLAWTLFHLDRLDEAERIFERLQGSNAWYGRALYGRALIANRRGDVDTAVALLERTGRADDLWLATSLLEAKQRYADAIPLYLRLARGSTAYADDAAYRASVLATRLGEPATARQAAALVPADSFFALRMGRPLDVPRPAPSGPTGGRSDTVPSDATTAPALQLARALAGVHDAKAAVGELLFKLRTLGATTDARGPLATDRENDIVAVAQMLQSLHEYRQSVYAARALISAGSRSLAVWRLAYPTAFAPDVERQAAAAGVSPTLVWAVMRKESAFSPVAVSRSDAIGLMQVTPPTWDWLGTLQGDAPAADPFDPYANIRYGTYYLGFLMRQFSGDTALAVASYNRGQGYIGRLFDGPTVHGNFDDLYRAIDSYETREYMQAVLVNDAVYRALYPLYAAATP